MGGRDEGLLQLLGGRFQHGADGGLVQGQIGSQGQRCRALLGSSLFCQSLVIQPEAGLLRGQPELPGGKGEHNVLPGAPDQLPGFCFGHAAQGNATGGDIFSDLPAKEEARQENSRRQGGNENHGRQNHRPDLFFLLGFGKFTVCDINRLLSEVPL